MSHQRADQPGQVWVLVADADERAARALATRFRRLGLWAYPTTRGREAEELARAYRLTLAVIDVRLRDMAGHDLAARLRALDDRLSIVMTAGNRHAESEIQAREAGIVHFAPKPLDLRHLHAVVAKALGSAPALASGAGAQERPE
jgi:DNA-binding response OmpR family regulator